MLLLDLVFCNAFRAADLHGMDKSTSRAHQSFLAKLEAIASSAVRAAEKVAAKLIIVFTDTGLTASLVAKYRPSVPILTLVVPRLINENMRWKVRPEAAAQYLTLCSCVCTMSHIYACYFEENRDVHSGVCINSGRSGHVKR